MNTIIDIDLSNLVGFNDAQHYRLIPNAALITTPFQDPFALIDYISVLLDVNGNFRFDTNYCKRQVDTVPLDHGFNTQAAIVIPQSAYQVIPIGPKLLGKRPNPIH
jgi:hypothetical protein